MKANYGNISLSDQIKDFAYTARNKALLARQQADTIRANPTYDSPFFAGQRDKELRQHEETAAKWDLLATVADEGYVLFDAIDPVFSCKHDGLVGRAAAQGRVRYAKDESDRLAAIQNKMVTQPGVTQQLPTK